MENLFGILLKLLKKSKSTIQSIVKTYKLTGRIEKQSRNVNRLRLNRRHQLFILREIRKDPTVSSVKLAADLENYYGIQVCARTVRNHIHKLGFKSRVAARKPFINCINRRKRIVFAKKYLSMGFKFWKRVIFSDESKFNIKFSDGHVKIWREKNTRLRKENLIPTFKHGGGRSVMIWACFGANGVGNLHFIDGIMDHKQYINILKKNLHESAQKLCCGRRYIFQQDNDPKHKAHNTRLWILYNCPKYLETPPQSPDINPIENLFYIFKYKLNYYNIRNVDDLKSALKAEWEKIPPDLTKKLVNSMPNRLKAVLKHKGYPTKY